MKEEELLAMLRREIREERSKLEDWERVARGELDGSEVEALATDPESQAMLAACKPLGEDAAVRIEARIERVRHPQVRAITSATKPRLRFVSIARIAAPLAAAAAVVFALRLNSGNGESLPAYGVSASGGSALVRGESNVAVDRITVAGAPDERFELVARPATARSKPNAMHAYAFVMQDAIARPLAASVEIAEGGSIRVQGPVASLGAANEVRLVISDHPLDAPSAVTAASHADSSDHARVLRVTIERR